jgi:hypothetical protein
MVIASLLQHHRPKRLYNFYQASPSVTPLHPDSSPAVLGSPGSLPTLGALPGLPNRTGTPLEYVGCRPCRPVLATHRPRGRVRRCPTPQQVPLSLVGRRLCYLKQDITLRWQT